LRTTFHDKPESRQIERIDGYRTKWARRIFAIVSTFNILVSATDHQSEGSVAQRSLGPYWMQITRKAGGLVPCKITSKPSPRRSAKRCLPHRPHRTRSGVTGLSAIPVNRQQADLSGAAHSGFQLMKKMRCILGKPQKRM
jgi:hypothetical protein